LQAGAGAAAVEAASGVDSAVLLQAPIASSPIVAAAAALNFSEFPVVIGIPPFFDVAGPMPRMWTRRF